MCCGIAGGLKGAAPSQASEVCHEVISLQVACISPAYLPERVLKAGDGICQGLEVFLKIRRIAAEEFLKKFCRRQSLTDDGTCFTERTGRYRSDISQFREGDPPRMPLFTFCLIIGTGACHTPVIMNRWKCAVFNIGTISALPACPDI